MNINFDVESLKEIGNKYETIVVITDYVRRVEVYKGTLDTGCFSMISFYLDNGWLDNCTWTKQETPLKGGWTRLVTEAVDKTGEEVFNITIKIKNRNVESSEASIEEKKINVPWFWVGIASAFFSIKELLEFAGIATVFGLATKRPKEKYWWENLKF